MEIRARIEKVEGLLEGNFRVAFLTPVKPVLTAYMGKDVVLTVKEKKEHRSLDANAYYWVLLSKLAEKLQTSKPELHNQMLDRYGQRYIADGHLVHVILPDTDEAAKRIEMESRFHLRPTSQTKTGINGETFRVYVMMKGSHDYDTAEMSHLINGLVSECKEQDIETIPPEELERMMKEYGKKQKEQGV